MKWWWAKKEKRNKTNEQEERKANIFPSLSIQSTRKMESKQRWMCPYFIVDRRIRNAWRVFLVLFLSLIDNVCLICFFLFSSKILDIIFNINTQPSSNPRLLWSGHKPTSSWKYNCLWHWVDCTLLHHVCGKLWICFRSREEAPQHPCRRQVLSEHCRSSFYFCPSCTIISFEPFFFKENSNLENS